jgi:uncharacterized protein (TIRG00374 family)
MRDSMTDGNRKYLLLTLKVTVAAALMGWLVSFVSASNIALAFKSADIRLVLSSIPLVLLSMWLAAAQLKIFTDCHGMTVSLLRIIGINASTEFYNLFLPGILAGGAIRWYRLSRDNKMRVQAFVVIVMNRLVNLYALLMVGVLGWWFEDTRGETQWVFAILLTCLLSLTCGFFVLSNRRLAASLRRIVKDSDKLRPYFETKLLQLIDAVNEYRQISGSDRARLICYATSWHVVILASTYVFCLSLGIAVSIGVLAWIRTVITLALLLPVTISGFGVREGGWIYFLGLYGVAPAEAFALSLLTFVRNVFQAAIGLTLETKILTRIGNT